jgi:hypothetical protein
MTLRTFSAASLLLAVAVTVTAPPVRADFIEAQQQAIRIDAMESRLRIALEEMERRLRAKSEEQAQQIQATIARVCRDAR